MRFSQGLGDFTKKSDLFSFSNLKKNLDSSDKTNSTVLDDFKKEGTDSFDSEEFYVLREIG